MTKSINSYFHHKQTAQKKHIQIEELYTKANESGRQNAVKSAFLNTILN